MKKSFIICFFIIVLGAPCFARDFLFDYIEENYKEAQAEFSYSPLIYHSIQVNSSVGPKILILTGDDYNYRNWLRHYIAQNKKFIAKISEKRVEEFLSAKAFEIDVTSLHPFNGKKWPDDATATDQSSLLGDNHILIVDPNEKRSHLIQTIIEKMDFRAEIFQTGEQALASFKVQPDKFTLIITQYTDIGIPSDRFIEQVLKINQKIPIVIDTGYKNQNLENEVMSKFSGAGSVHIKPVILRNLQKTIETLTKKNA